jgi:6-phosphogluconate dehydrogenase (decarboxylating)
MIGLGRMGSNRVRRLLRDGHVCVVHDRNEAAVRALSESGAAAAPSPVLTLALYERFSSRGESAFGRRVLSALRAAFGGHPSAQEGPG